MAKKKGGLGDNPLSWIRDTNKDLVFSSLLPQINESKSNTYRAKKCKSKLTQKVNINLEKKDFLYVKHLLEDIIRSRDNIQEAIALQFKPKKEISENTIIKILIKLLRGLEFDRRNILNEEELYNRILASVKRESVKGQGSIPSSDYSKTQFLSIYERLPDFLL